MRVLFCDNAGYSNYTPQLCLSACKLIDSDSIYYLTDKNNSESEKCRSAVHVYKTITSYNASRRGSISWYADRLSLPMRIVGSRSKEIKELEPDVLFLQAYYPLLDQFMLNTYKNWTRVVLTVHNVIPHEKNWLWSMKSLRKVYKQADHLIVHTKKNKDELMNSFGIESESISVINHGIDIEYTKIGKEQGRKAIGVQDDKPIFLAYGGIRDYKGLDMLIPALRGIDCHLIIAGSISNNLTFDSYQNQIVDNSIDALNYIEYISDEFTNVLFQVCDFVVLPYKDFHSQSGVLMQAIKYGKCVIATDVGSFKEFVNDFNLGYICKPNDIDSLHDCIERAVHERDRAREINDIAPLFSWDTAARSYVQVAEKVMYNDYAKR